MKNATVDMTRGPLAGKIVRFVIPLILTKWLQMLFSAADTVVLGRCVGDKALAAVGATAVFIQLIAWIFIGLSAGVSVGIAQDFGAGDDDSLTKSIHTAMTSSVFIGIILMALGFFLARTVLRLLGTPEEIIDGSVLYLKIFVLGVPATLVYQFGAAVMRALGDSKKPVFYLAFSGGLNVVLNLIAVLVFKLEIIGVAAATVISQYVSAVLLVRYMRRQDERFRLRWDKLGICFDKLGKMLKIGVPAALQGLLFSASDIALQTAVNSLGSLAISGNAAALSVDGFIFIPMESFTQACMVISGQNIGAKKFRRSKRAIALCGLLAGCVGLCVGVLVFIFKTPLLRLALPDTPEAVAFGAGRLSIVTTTCFIYGILDCISAALRSYGSSATPAIISIVGICGFRLSWVAFFFPTHRTMCQLYLCYPIAWVICIIAETAALAFVIKKRIAAERLTGYDPALEEI
ncbi:MAG: MATE family efflux transporter [Oscillospiraceae bacterium]|nr:MATE family efflux transporter [Oscillospiraceae bacterium]